MSKIITVFGATGNQGGSVIKHILEDHSLSKEYKIRAITRDTTKKSAQDLADQGVEIVSVCCVGKFIRDYYVDSQVTGRSEFC
jgi:hypothetical protein